MLTKIFTSLLYRTQQFWWNISARPLSATQQVAIQQHLTTAEYTLFQRYSLTDQHHAYRVMRTLQKAGYNQPVLLTAALLHDIGKCRAKITVIDRILVVLGKRLARNVVTKWGEIPLNRAKRWQRPFIIRQQHPQWGADLAQQTATDPLALKLIQHHQDKSPPPLEPPFNQLLSSLQWADDLN